DVLGMHARGIGQRGPGTGTNGLDGFARVEPVELRAGEGFAVLAVHGWRLEIKSGRSLPPLAGEVPEGRWGRAEGADVASMPPAPTPALPRRRRRERSEGSVALVERHEDLVFGAGVVRAGADDLAVDALLDHVRAPAAGACDHEQWREHRGRHAHHVVAHRAEPVEVGEHLLDVPHHRFQALGDVVHPAAALLVRQLAGHGLDHFIARIAGGVDRVAEADHHLLAFDPRADVGLGVVWRVVALLDLERDFVGAAVLGATQRADRAGDAR